MRFRIVLTKNYPDEVLTLYLVHSLKSVALIFTCSEKNKNKLPYLIIVDEPCDMCRWTRRRCRAIGGQHLSVFVGVFLERYEWILALRLCNREQLQR